LAALSFNELTAKSETNPAARPVVSVEPLERLKDHRMILGGDAGTIIDNGEKPKVVVLPFGGHANPG
jgi:hypothetical protein